MKNKEYGVKLTADISDIEKKIKKVKDLTKKTSEQTKMTLFDVPEGYKKVGHDIMETEKHFKERMSKVRVKINEPTTDERYKQFNPKDTTETPETDAYLGVSDENIENNFKKAQEAGVSMNEWAKGIEKVNEKMAETTTKIEPIKDRAIEIRQEIEKLVGEYKEAKSHKFGQLFSSDDVKNAEDIENKVNELLDELEDLEGQDLYVKGIADFEDGLEEAKDETYSLSDAMEDLKSNISKTFSKGITNIKRFSLSLLGIHSIWTALSRAVHSYSSLDDSMSKRIQANWIAIGAIFEPIVNKIVKGLQKIVAYINVFVKAFTGGDVDLLSKAMKAVEKSTGKTTKAVKGLNKELATLDEITNLNFDQSSGIGDEGDFGIGDALKEIENIELDPKIKKFVEDLGKNLKKISDTVLPFLKENIELVIGALTIFFGFLAIDKIATFAQHVANLAGVFGNLGYQAKHAEGNVSGASSGLIFAIGLLITTTAGLISAIKRTNDEEQELINKMKDAKYQAELLSDAKDKLKNATLDYENAVDNEKTAQENLNRVQQETGLNGEQIYNQVKDGTLKYEELTGATLQAYKAYRDLVNAQDEVKKSKEEEIKASSEAVKKEFDVQIAKDKTGKTYDKIKEQIIKANKEGKISNEDASDSMSRMTADMNYKTTQVFTKDIPKNIKKGMNTGQYKTTLDKFQNVMSYEFDHIGENMGKALLRGFENIIIPGLGSYHMTASGANKWFGWNLPTIPGFAGGNVAYGPTVAEFGEYAGARSNPEITSPQSLMKETMIEALQEANMTGNNRSGDTILYVNGKELARATYDDYRKEGNRLGSSSVAIRRV